MTAIIGFCTQRGAFLAADSRQMRRVGTTWVPATATTAKKIVRLTPWAVLGLSGAGLLGNVQDQLVGRRTAVDTSLDNLIGATKNVLRDIHAAGRFIEQKDIPNRMTAIVAGRDQASGTGFLCLFEDSRNFEPEILVGCGKACWTGSAGLQAIVETVARELRGETGRLPLDRWALESLSRVADIDQSVALPAQLMLIDETITEVTSADLNTSSDPRFLVESAPPL